MNPLTQFKKIRILPLLIALGARRVRVARVGYVAAREHNRTVEHDRREHGRRLRSVPSRGLHLHGLHLGCRV